MSHPKKPRLSRILVVVLVLENPDRIAIRLTEQISCTDIGLFAVAESQCTEDEDEDDDEHEDDSKFRNLGLISLPASKDFLCHRHHAVRLESEFILELLQRR